MMSEILNNTSKAAKLEREEEKSGICIAYHEGTCAPTDMLLYRPVLRAAPSAHDRSDGAESLRGGGSISFFFFSFHFLQVLFVHRSTLCATMQYVRPGLAGSLVFKNQDPGPV